MSTRSYIGYKDGNNVIYAYCHFDGYVEHNGVILNECYNTLNKVKTLVDRGDFSSLSANIKGVQYYENEPSSKSLLSKYKYDENDDIEFLYVFDEKTGWSFDSAMGRYNLKDFIETHSNNENIKNMKDLLASNYQTWENNDHSYASLYDEKLQAIDIFFFDTLEDSGDRHIHIFIPVKDQAEALIVSDNICGLAVECICKEYKLETDYFTWSVSRNGYGRDAELWNWFAEIMREQNRGPFYSPVINKDNVDLTFNIYAYKDNCKVKYIYDNCYSSYLPLTDEMKEKVFEFIVEKRQNIPLKTEEREEIK